jgi:hypothetical protein
VEVVGSTRFLSLSQTFRIIAPEPELISSVEAAYRPVSLGSGAILRILQVAEAFAVRPTVVITQR